MAKRVPRLDGINKDCIPPEILAGAQPVILSGLVGSWPLVGQAQCSDAAVMDYLKSFYNGRSTIVCKLPPEARGRLFYDATCTRLEYSSYIGRIDEVLDEIAAGLTDPQAPGFYIASNIVDTHLPGLRQDNDLCVPRAPEGSFRSSLRAWALSAGGSESSLCCCSAVSPLPSPLWDTALS